MLVFLRLPLQNLRSIVFSIYSILIAHETQNSFFTMSENFKSRCYSFFLGLEHVGTKCSIAMCPGVHTAPWPREPGLLSAGLQGDHLSLSSKLKAKHKDALVHHTTGRWGRRLCPFLLLQNVLVGSSPNTVVLDVQKPP